MTMARYGNQFGPDISFCGVPMADLDAESTWADADVVIIGAPFDGGTSYRSGSRFGPSSIRGCDYLPYDGSRPSLAMRTDGLIDLKVVDVGDVEMYSGDAAKSCADLEAVVEKVAKRGPMPIILGGDHTITWPNATGVARATGWGRVSVIHFDAHADTGDITFGSLIGHGQPMRRLIESGAVRGDRFWQVGLRGYWPEPETLAWMAQQQMRSYEMTEITARSLEQVITELIHAALVDCDGVFISVDVDVVDPGMAPGTGTPEPGGLTGRQLLDTVRRLAYELPIVGLDVVEVAPPFDMADITSLLGNRVVLEVLSSIARRRRDSEEGTTWNPKQPLLDGR
jgi:agmatinase